jgi:hypothetical protein
VTLLWYLDRAAGLVAYPSLYVAVLTGIFYNTPSFGVFHAAARRIHVEVATFATVVTLAHAALGVADTWAVTTGTVPAPNYSLAYFLAGVAVGVGALVLVIVAIVGFLDPGRFDQPWGPRVVHAFAYGGFVFGTIHAAAVGTDLLGLVRPLLAPSVVFLGYVLVLRLLVWHGVTGAADGSPSRQ